MPRETTGDTSTQMSRTVLDRYLDALVAGDRERIADSFAEDATWDFPGDTPLSGLKFGRDAIVDFLFGAAPLWVTGSQSFVFGDQTIEGERAVLEWQVRGTSTATGKAYHNRYSATFVIRDGRISAVREYLDTRHAAQVLFGM